MKKVILSLAIVTIATLSATAQTGQGTWLIGGSASFSSTSESGVSGSLSTISLMPKAGYFFADDFAGGLGINLVSQSESGSTSSTFQIAPFVRYYFLPLGDNAKLFGNASVGFGSQSETGSPSVSSTAWQISAGPAFFLNQHTALEAALAYGSDKVSGAPVSENTFSILVGFQIHIGGGASKKK
jgi:hypothetical protein